MTRVARTLPALVAAAALLAACGTRGAPKPPEDTEDVYPRTYPSSEEP